MNEANLLKTRVVAALVLRISVEEFRLLKKIIVEKFGVLFPFHPLITTPPKGRKEQDE